MDETLQKVTFNLFASDVALAEKRWGYGWSTRLRYLLRRELKMHQKVDEACDGQ